MRKIISKLNPRAADMLLHTHFSVHFRKYCAEYTVHCTQLHASSLFVVLKVEACVMGRVEAGDSCQQDNYI